MIIQADLQKDSYIAAYNLKTGKLAWKTPREEIWRYLQSSNKLVEQLYILDKQEKFNATTKSPEHKKFVSERLAAGTQMLRDLWWTAWVTSDPKLTPPVPPRPAN